MKRIMNLNLLVILLIVMGTISITEVSWGGIIDEAFKKAGKDISDTTKKAGKDIKKIVRPSNVSGKENSEVIRSAGNAGSVNLDIFAWYYDGRKTKERVQQGEEFPLVWRNMAGGKCLDVNGGRPDNGTNVQSWSCHSGEPQMWKRRDVSDVWFLLENKASLKCLDVAAGGKVDGTNVQSWQCDLNNINQHWKTGDAGDGWVYLINRVADRCLDVKYSQTQDGADVWSWGCNQTAAQKWWME